MHATLKPIGERYSLWSSISRAVRIPSRIDDDVRLDSLGPAGPNGEPTLTSVQGSSQFDAEKLIAYEVGFRGEPAESIQFDVAAFYHDYDDLLYVSPGEPFIEADPSPAHIVTPIILNNDLKGEAYGAEIYGSWRPAEWVEVGASYSYLNLEFALKGGAPLIIPPQDLENRTPEHQANLRLHLDLPHSFGFDAITYYVDSEPSQMVESYVRQDLHIGYSASADLSFHLYVQNLLDSSHREADTPRGVEVERTFMANVRYRFD